MSAYFVLRTQYTPVIRARAIAARVSIPTAPPGQASSSNPTATAPSKPKAAPPTSAKKSGKVTLKGVVVKKRKSSSASPQKADTQPEHPLKEESTDLRVGEDGPKKRPRISVSDSSKSK